MIINSKMPEVVCDNLILHPEEFCYVVYMPVKIGKKTQLPSNLFWSYPIMDHIKDEDWLNFEYWYLTIKHMWVDGYGNREGWHIDGFGTDDINYIWSDCLPTVFSPQQFDLSEDHNQSLIEMSNQAKFRRKAKPNQLLRLDTTMVHRPAYTDKPLLRTFIKVSCSNHLYNLKGNARNPHLDLGCEYVERKAERNHPIGGIK